MCIKKGLTSLQTLSINIDLYPVINERYRKRTGFDF